MVVFAARKFAPMKHIVLSMTMIGCLAAGSVQAQIYIGGGAESGTAIVLSNFASAETPTVLIPSDRARDRDASGVADSGATSDQRAAGGPSPLRQLPTSLLNLIGDVAREYALEAALLKALIAVESNFDPNARSHKGAMGLMQLMPETARRFNVRDAFVVAENVRGGAAYLRWLLDYFAGDVALALAAYNAGEGAVMRAGRRIPDIAETRAYVPKVLSLQTQFRRTDAARAAL
jgi:hypothetical protein